MNTVLLHLAALLVPGAHRDEWLAEWRSELWYVVRDRGDITRFCLGAFRDAYWLRRHAPLPRCYGSLLIEVRPCVLEPQLSVESRFLESPAACIACLGALATLSLALAFLLPAAHAVVFRPLDADPRTLAMLGPFRQEHGHPYWLLLNLLAQFVIAWLIVPATTSLSLGDYPASRHWRRRWIFFVAKIALLLPVVVLGSLDLACLGSSVSPLLMAGLAPGIMAVRWALIDQRRRCPECLRLLSSPVRIGQASRTLLDWYGTEFLCHNGHGLLHVPEGGAIWFDKQRWLSLGRSWNTLF